jgi:radical SAM protein with 4Fe4S-binding SPASM domain
MKVNKNQIILADRFHALRFFLSRGKGHLFRYLLNRARWYWYPKLGYVSKFPDHLDIEITNKCNMNCPMCFRPIMFKGGITPGLMDFKLFKKIIDEAGDHHAYSIRLSWRGEPLVHPKVVDMIKYAKQKGIKEVSFLTNGLNLKGKLAEDLVKSGLDWITVSFDGLGETYERIRKPAKFGEALQRLKDFQEIKKKLGTTKPVLKVQSIWPAIEKDPQKYYDTFKDIADNISSNPYKSYYESDKIEHDPNFVCPQPWHRFVITWDGKATQCICTYMEEGVVGDVNKQPIADIWRGEKFNHVRKLQRQRNRLVMACCQKCFDGSKKKQVKVKVGDREVKEYAFDKGTAKTKKDEIKEIISQK